MTDYQFVIMMIMFAVMEYKINGIKKLIEGKDEKDNSINSTNDE